MRKLTIALFLALAVIPLNVSAKTHSQDRPMALHLVQKIYVEDMGTSPEAARFRLLLEDQLSENGFVVVAKREEADAVLSGATTPQPTFVVDKPGSYNVQLVVNNGIFSSSPSTVQPRAPSHGSRRSVRHGNPL